MSAPSPVALSAATALTPWRYPCPVCHRVVPVGDDLALSTHRGDKELTGFKWTRAECPGSRVLFDDEVIAAVPWLTLARHIVGRIRLSPGSLALGRVLDSLFDTIPAAASPTSSSALEAIALWEGAVRSVAHSSPAQPPLPASIGTTPARRGRFAADWIMLEAAHVALCGSNDPLSSAMPIAPPSLSVALGALFAEFRTELRGAARWFVTPHAIGRYQERFSPNADDDEIRATLHRVAAVADVSAPADRGVSWSRWDHPGVRLVVADNTVVTVLTTGRWRREDSGRRAARARASERERDTGRDR